MNTQLYNLGLFLVWLSVAIWFLIVGPMVNPRQFDLNTQHQMLGGAAIMLALWNLVRWWMIRSELKRRAAARAAHSTAEPTRNPLARKESPKVTHPEFQFDEPPQPPPSSNGAPR